MSNFSNILNTQLMLLLLIAVGVVAGKVGLLKGEVGQVLSNLVISIFLPCNIVSSFMVDNYDPSLIHNFLLAVLIGFVVETILFFLSGVLFRRVKDDRNPILRYATVSPNSGFVGIPVINGFYGSTGVLYLSAFLIPLYFFMWGFGLSFLTKMNAKEIAKKLATSPALIAIVIGVVLLLTGFRPPAFLGSTISALASCTTPVSLIVTGGVLAGISPRSIVNKIAIYYSSLRLLIIPLAVLGALVLLGVPALVTAVVVIALAMPTAAATVMLATVYDANASYASELLFFSTVVSMVTIPLMGLLVNSAVGL